MPDGHLVFRAWPALSGRLVFGVLLASLLAWPATPPKAAALPEPAVALAVGSSSELVLLYDVYWSFVPLLRIESRSSVSSDVDYKISQVLSTTGLTGKLFPWYAKSFVQGVRREGELQPAIYESQSRYREDKQSIDMHWHDGQPLAHVEGRLRGVPQAEKVPAAMLGNTVDPLTAVANLVSGASAEVDCKGTRRVFDGIRRYDLRYGLPVSDDVPDAVRDLATGAVRECAASIVPIAGFPSEQGPETAIVRGWFGQRRGLDREIPLGFEISGAKGSLDVQMVEAREEVGLESEARSRERISDRPGESGGPLRVAVQAERVGGQP